MVALVPLRLATVMVTAGNSAPTCACGSVLQCSLAYAEVHVVGWLGWAVNDLIGHIAQQDRPPVTDAEDDLFDIFFAGEQRSGFDADLLVLIRELSGLNLCIRRFQLCHHSRWRQ